MTPAKTHFTWRILRTLLVAYCAICLMMLFLENKLLYPAPRYPDAGNWDAQTFKAVDVNFNSQDGTALHGWYWEYPQPRAHLIYFHGNGDCVGYLGSYLSEFSQKHKVSVFAFDYRGYGRSAGSPAEQGIIQDGHAAREWLAKRAGISSENIVLMGRSLGGGVAVDVAANGGARGLILQNTFTSLPDVASRIYWFLPVRLLMRNQYRSVDKLPLYSGPLLQSHGTLDTVVPYDIGERLFQAAAGNKQFFAIPGGDHNDPEPDEYEAQLAKFIRGLP